MDNRPLGRRNIYIVHRLDEIVTNCLHGERNTGISSIHNTKTNSVCPVDKINLKMQFSENFVNFAWICMTKSRYCLMVGQNLDIVY